VRATPLKAISSFVGRPIEQVVYRLDGLTEQEIVIAPGKARR
jgi:hypothetical protein